MGRDDDPDQASNREWVLITTVPPNKLCNEFDDVFVYRKDNSTTHL